MAAIAGSKGRIEEPEAACSPWRVELARALMAREVSAEDALSFFCDNARLREVSAEINMVCNLHCDYCYLAKRETDGTAPLHVWKSRLGEAATQGVSLIAIVGKEPFIDARGADVLAFLDDIRRKHDLVFRCGTVTNGTLLDRHIHALANIGRIDYLDISLDGLGSRHDEIRGPGSFEKAMRGFQAARTLPNLTSLFVNSTIHQRNAGDVPDFVLGLVDSGVENIHFSPVLNFTADPAIDSMLLSPDQVGSLIDELVGLADRVPGQIIFELPIEYVWRFLGDAIISADHIQEDKNGVLFVRPDPAKRFYLKTAVFPGYFWDSARISHEGLYLSELDTVAWALPEYALGNIQEQSILDIFAQARSKGGWFEEYFLFTLERLVRLARRGGLVADDFPSPDAWRRNLSTSAEFPVLTHT